MNWMIQKKIYSPLDFLCSILLNIFNITVLTIVFDLFCRLFVINNSSWYQEAVRGQTEADIFYAEKSDILFYTITAVLLVVVCYSVYTMWMFWGQQRGRLHTQIGVFVAEGYTYSKVQNMLTVDVLFDMVIALMVCFGVYRQYCMIGMRNEMWLSLYKLTGENSRITIWVVAVAGMVYAMAAILFHRLWIKKIRKRGIAELIKSR